MLAYLWLKRDDKSVRESLDAQNKAFESLSKTLDKIDDRLREHDERARNIYNKQARACELLNTIVEHMNQQGSSPTLTDVGKGGLQ